MASIPPGQPGTGSEFGPNADHGVAPGANPTPDPSSDPGKPWNSAEMHALEARVRHTMDRLTELVEAQLPEAVDSLKGDLEQMRADMAAGLAKGSADLAEERQQLRVQITSTVSAANLWFVRTRDQLYERLDQIAEAAAEAQQRAEEAQAQAQEIATEAAARLAAVPPPAELEAGEPEPEPAFEWDVEGEEADEPAPSRFVPSIVSAPPPPPPEAPAAGVAAAGVATPAAGDEFGAMAAHLRGDVQELQAEVSAMGEAVFQLREEVERLRGRIPARPRAATIDRASFEALTEALTDAVTEAAAMAAAEAVRAAQPVAKRAAPARKATARRAAPAPAEPAGLLARRAAATTKARAKKAAALPVKKAAVRKAARRVQ